MAENKASASVEKCIICFDTNFKDPRVLPCGHTFCKDCLEKIFQHQNEPKSQQVAGAISKTKAIQMPPSTKEVSSDENTGKASEVESSPQALSGLDHEVQTSSLEPTSSENQPMDDEHVVQETTLCCPVCQAKHKVEKGKIDNFLPDYFILQQIEGERIAKSQSTGICNACLEDNKQMEGVCSECPGFIICAKCVALHNKLPVYNSHIVTSLTDFSPEKYIPKKKHHMCCAHDMEVIFYCNTCSHLICQKCVTANKGHKTHNFVSLDEADTELRSEVEQMSELARNNLTTFEQYGEYVQSMEKDIVDEGYVEELKTIINTSINGHIRKVEARREQLLKQVEDDILGVKKNFWAAKDYIERKIRQINSGMRFTEKAKSCKNTTESINMNKQGKDLLSQVTEAKWDHESIPPPLIYRYPQETDILIPLGEVSPICSGDIVMELKDQRTPRPISKAKLGEEVILSIKFKVQLMKSTTILFQILYGKMKQIHRDVAHYEDEGGWNVEFVPRCTGKHIVQVWLGGRPVAKEFSVTGSLTVGQRVQPGPDWQGPQTVMFGKVTNYSTFRKTVTVDWKDEEDHIKDGDEMMGLELAEPLDGDVRQHKWGDDEEYEVELVL